MVGTTDKLKIQRDSYMASARIVVAYAVFALLWIVLSDQALMLMFDEPATLVKASIIKGWAFVLVTAALLFFLVFRLVSRIKLASENDRRQRLRKAREFRAHSERVHAQLEQRVAMRTAELTAANQELDAFAYAVSHDLRAPLRAMSGFSEALIEDHASQLDDEARQYLDQIIIASGKMNELIDGILVLSRSTRGELQRQDVNLSEIARQQIDRLLRAGTDRETEVEVEIEPDLIVKADPATIEAVVNNLIDNAWKYTRNTSKPRISFKTGLLDEAPAFCVEDNGAGFDMAHADKLFKAFQRLHRQDEFPGTGIGLATVDRIIKRHGGRIEANASAGQGARFCFTLPQGDSEEQTE